MRHKHHIFASFSPPEFCGVFFFLQQVKTSWKMLPIVCDLIRRLKKDHLFSCNLLLVHSSNRITDRSGFDFKAKLCEIRRTSCWVCVVVVVVFCISVYTIVRFYYRNAFFPQCIHRSVC